MCRSVLHKYITLDKSFVNGINLYHYCHFRKLADKHVLKISVSFHWVLCNECKCKLSYWSLLKIYREVECEKNLHDKDFISRKRDMSSPCPLQNLLLWLRNKPNKRCLRIYKPSPVGSGDFLLHCLSIKKIRLVWILAPHSFSFQQYT